MNGPRTLGFGDLLLYGAALNFSIRWLATAAAAGPASLPIWLLAGIGFLAPLSIASAELAGRYPGEGGVYAWSRATLGPFWGFVCGWLYWACNLPFFSGLIFFIVTVAATALGPEAQAAIKNDGVVLAAATVIALVPPGLHLLGLGAGKWLPAFGAAATLALLAALLGVGGFLGWRDGPATDFATASYLPPLDANGAILWGTMVFAFGGAEAVTLLHNETRGGMRTVMRALVVCGALLVCGYIAGTLALLSIFQPGDATRLDGVPEAIRIGFEKAGLGAFASPALLLLALAMLGAYAAWFGVAARLPLAVGVDKLLPPAFGRRDPRTGAPVAALLVQTGIVLVLVVLSRAGETLSGAYDFLVAMGTLSYTAPFLFLFLAYIVALRSPAPAGVWTAPGGRLGAALVGYGGAFVSLSAIACSLVPSPDASDPVGATVKLVVASVVMAGSGVALYLMASRTVRP